MWFGQIMVPDKQKWRDRLENLGEQKKKKKFNLYH